MVYQRLTGCTVGPVYPHGSLRITPHRSSVVFRFKRSINEAVANSICHHEIEWL
jgi:hypothetical protein